MKRSNISRRQGIQRRETTVPLAIPSELVKEKKLDMPLRDKLSRNLVKSAVEEFSKQHESNSIVGQENDDFYNNSESVVLSESS